MIVGDQWLDALLSIPIIAIVPFAAVIWGPAPDGANGPQRAPGGVAGASCRRHSATAYAFHCMDDTRCRLFLSGTADLRACAPWPVRRSVPATSALVMRS